MGYDYFYGRQPEQYQFYKLPKMLVKDKSLKKVSMDAKVLYSLMLDRAALSAENGWTDDQGRVYIIYTLEEICKDMCCARQKAAKLLKELEDDCDLIRRKYQRLCRPNLIYVMNFASGTAHIKKDDRKEAQGDQPGMKTEPPEVWKSNSREYENHTTGSMEIEPPGVRKSYANKTDNNKTDKNHTDSSELEVKAADHIHVYSGDLSNPEQYRSYFHEQLDLPVLYEMYPCDRNRIDEIIALLTDVCSGNAEKIRVNEEEKPGSVVRSVLMGLNHMHIGYVLHSLNETKTEIRNMRGYLLTLLYNAPVSMSNYYQARVNHDMSSGLLTGGDEDHG